MVFLPIFIIFGRVWNVYESGILSIFMELANMPNRINVQ